MTCCLGYEKNGDVWIASDSAGSSGEYCRVSSAKIEARWPSRETSSTSQPRASRSSSSPEREEGELRVGFLTWPSSAATEPELLWAMRLGELARLPIAGETVRRQDRVFTVQHVVHDLDRRIPSAPREGLGLVDVRLYLVEALAEQASEEKPSA